MRSEMRQNKATKLWVIYSLARRKRPRDFHALAEAASPLPEKDENCPFCTAGGEMEEGGAVSFRNAGGGLVRAIPNKYPALFPEGTTRRKADGIHLSMDGFGYHEVIIETPRHDLQPSQMLKEEMELVVESYHRRYLEHMSDDRSMMAIIFRNHGYLAGASLLHAHSQLIVTAVVPTHIRWQEEEAQRYFDEWGRCVYCDILEHELKEGTRVVMENRHFAAFIPYAAEVPFETWIVPKTHRSDFGDISEEEKADFSEALRHVLARLYEKLKDPDYNYVLYSSARYRSGEPRLHWYLQIRPKLMTRAGFEIGSGMSINPSIPEEDAAFLRGE